MPTSSSNSDLSMYNRESTVSSYCRLFPVQFSSGIGSTVTDSNSKTYLDFLSGCGSLNYGHNHPELKQALLNYISNDGLAMSLDLHTQAKSHFLQTFAANILEPRSLDYLLQFCGPTGSNANEAAIKLARKITGRSNIVSFTRGFHGCTMGSLSLTGNNHHRSPSIHQLMGVTHLPYEGYLGSDVDTSELLIKLIEDTSSGVDLPAAIILETIQGEGGLNTASAQWAQKIAAIAKKHGILLIVDDIQAGCGRSGTFFSFEPLDIVPDIVTLAKSISGFGLPMSLLLMRKNLDHWFPGEHNGTFRGNNHAFVTAAKALELFWATDEFMVTSGLKMDHLISRLQDLSLAYGFALKGRGMMSGLDIRDGTLAKKILMSCFDNGLMFELCGPNDEVIKLLPPLTATLDELDRGMEILATAMQSHCSSAKKRSKQRVSDKKRPAIS